MTTQHPVKAPKKLIEVALPLIAINEASVRESYIYRANPSSLHKWWAQRPMAAARAVLDLGSTCTPATSTPLQCSLPASSAESVGEFRFGQVAKCVIQSDFAQLVNGLHRGNGRWRMQARFHLAT